VLSGLQNNPEMIVFNPECRRTNIIRTHNIVVGGPWLKLIEESCSIGTKLLKLWCLWALTFRKSELDQPLVAKRLLWCCYVVA